MRVFVAIDLPDELKKNLIGFNKEIQKADFIRGNFAKPNQFHLTLKFIGEISEENIIEIKKILQKVAEETKKSKLQLKGVGHFNSRVLWVGGESAEIINLANKVDAEISKLGFQKEQRPFAVHITLVRIKHILNRKKFAEFLEKNKEKEFGVFVVDKIKLVKSTLKEDGAEYETIAEFPLL